MEKLFKKYMHAIRRKTSDKKLFNIIFLGQLNGCSNICIHFLYFVFMEICLCAKKVTYKKFKLLLEVSYPC